MARLSDRPSAASYQVQAFLETADLRRSTMQTTGDHFGVHPRGLGSRLRHAGTTFQQLKDAERMRRLRIHMARDQIVPKRDCEKYGFSHSNGLLRFFKQRMGKTLREYKRERAAG